MDISLYERIGGKPIIYEIADLLYEKILNDDEFYRFFSNKKVEKIKSKFCLFLFYSLGGMPEYTGKNLKKTHAPLMISNEQFDIFLKYIKESLLEANVHDGNDEVMTLIESQRKYICVSNQSEVINN